MKHLRGGVRVFIIAALGLAALVAWALWPADQGPSGASISELAKQRTGFAGPVSSKVIPADDLPPEGTRSLFDHLITQNDGLPYPFEKLVAMLTALHPDGQPPVSLMIPDGRSLLKAQADFAHPRVLVAADFQAPGSDSSLGLATRGLLFLGFVENASEIEVISWNEAAGRFEFQLVQDYRADGVPRIVYARRAVCTTCHQGAAPIFPQRSWTETNGQPGIAAKIIEARGSDAPYLGLPLSNTLAAPERFDELTDVGNFLPVAQRAWLDVCGEEAPAGADCRRQMLKVALQFALSPGDFDRNSDSAEALRAMQRQGWPKDGLIVPESDLRNRDPLAESEGLRGLLRSVFKPEPSGPGAKSNEELDAFDRLPRLPPELDPLTPRRPKKVIGPDDLDTAFGLAQFFTVADLEALEAAAGYDNARIIAAVDGVPAELFAATPFTRPNMVNALLLSLGAPGRQYAWLDTSQMSEPRVLGVPPLELAQGSPLEPFQEYCFACHRGNPARRLDFMGGKTEDEVLARVKDTGSIRDVLDWERYRGTEKEGTLMPPADSHQRAELEAALKRGEPVLEEMRKVVPSLFDF